MRVSHSLAVGGASEFPHLFTVGNVSPKQPLFTTAQAGIYNAGPSYAITRDELNNVEGVFGADVAFTVFGSVSDHPVFFRTNNLDRMTINTAGNVGIGITSPASKLHVVGAVNFTGLRTLEERHESERRMAASAATQLWPACVARRSEGAASPGSSSTKCWASTGRLAADRATRPPAFGTVAGGRDNVAGGVDSVVTGGRANAATGVSSFAAGFRAKANHEGTFVWGDSAAADFASTASKQFLIRAGACRYQHQRPSDPATRRRRKHLPRHARNRRHS